MVGGKVVDVVICNEKIWVNCEGAGSEQGETCAVYLERNPDSERILPGDSLWWQGRRAYWTPHGREFSDRAIPRIGYSGVDVRKEEA